MTKTTAMALAVLCIFPGCTKQPLTTERENKEVAYWLPADAKFKQAKTCTKRQKSNWKKAGVDCGKNQVYWLKRSINIEDIKTVSHMKYIVQNGDAGCELPIV